MREGGGSHVEERVGGREGGRGDGRPNKSEPAAACSDLPCDVWGCLQYK